MLGTQQAGWTVAPTWDRALGKILLVPQSGGGMQKGSLPSGHCHIWQFCKTLYSGPTLPSEKNTHMTSEAFAVLERRRQSVITAHREHFTSDKAFPLTSPHLNTYNCGKLVL